MPDIDTIRTGLNSTRAALGQAQAAANTADARAEQITRHAAASGFIGIATGMNQVRQDLGELLAMKHGRCSTPVSRRGPARPMHEGSGLALPGSFVWIGFASTC